MRQGMRNLITDVAGLRVGHAVDAGLRSGCSVLVGERPFTAAVHVMGGAPGTRETDLLAPERLVQEVDALVLSGGSAFGLDACSGVADGLRAMGRGFAVGDQRVPIVPGAILFAELAQGIERAAEGAEVAVDPHAPAFGQVAVIVIHSLNAPARGVAHPAMTLAVPALQGVVCLDSRLRRAEQHQGAIHHGERALTGPMAQAGGLIVHGQRLSVMAQKCSTPSRISTLPSCCL